MRCTFVSVTILIRRLKAGSHTALVAITGRFLARQERFAARLLGRAYPGVNGSDEVAIDVLHRLWIESQRPGNVRVRLSNTESLLTTLDMLTCQQVMRAKEFDRSKKRDISRTIRDADRNGPTGDSEPFASHNTDPTSGGADELTEGFTDRQKRIVALLEQGWLREELPAQLGCSLSTIRRELECIKAKLQS